MKCIRDKENTAIFSYIKKKHSVIQINEPESIVGELIIKSVRQYTYHYEVDVNFKGHIWGNGSYRPRLQKYEHTELPNLSKVKVYRAMRSKVFNCLKSKLSLFGVEINRIENISKIKWVG